ncbi:hypothetical protein E4T42_07416 [Aureobasidium subglaciale]|nr:hypothetical protein E4T42_07416 [Aureobasidium subglaciale]
MGVLAQETSTTSLFLGGPSISGQEYAGSVVTAGPSETVYALVCTGSACYNASTITVSPPTNPDDVLVYVSLGRVQTTLSHGNTVPGIEMSNSSSVAQATFDRNTHVTNRTTYQPKSQQTYTVGPSTFALDFVTTTLGVEASASETCKITGTEAAVCTFTMNVNIPDVTALSIESFVTLSGTLFNSFPVQLTAGLEKLASATAPASATGSASGSTSSSSSTRTASGSAVSSSTAASASAASASDSGSGASSIMSNGRSGDVLALVMFTAVVVSVGALMIL